MYNISIKFMTSVYSGQRWQNIDYYNISELDQDCYQPLQMWDYLDINISLFIPMKTILY